MTTCFYFKLVHNGETRYMNDEPIGWDSMPIVLKRDPDWHGVNYEFTKADADLDFDCEALGDWIDSIYENEGLDALIEFHYGTVADGEETEIYAGKLNLTTFKRSKNRVQCGLERSSLQEKIKSQFDTNLNLSDVKDLDGKTIDALELTRVTLHSKTIRKAFKTDPTKNIGINFSKKIYGDKDYQNYPVYVYFPTTQPIENTISGFITNSFQAQTSQSNTLIKIEEDPGDYEFNIITDITFSLYLNYAKWQSGNREYKYIRSKTVLVINGVSRIIGEEIYHERNLERSYSYNYNAKGNFKGKITLKSGDKVELFTLIEVAAEYFANFDININCNRSDISIVGNTKTDPSRCSGVMVHNVLDRTLQIISGQKGLLKSRFFGKISDGYELDGCEAFNLITNGFQVRKFGDDKPIQLTLKSVLNSLNAMFGLGLGYETINGVERVVIEPLEYFYAGKEILFIPDCADYEEESADELVFNLINIGYKDYPDEGAQLLDEFNTEQQYATPIKRHDNKFEQISELIASGYAIELTRRAQFVSNQETKNSTKYDDKNFVISCIPEADEISVQISFIAGTTQVTVKGKVQTLTTYKIIGGPNDGRDLYLKNIPSFFFRQSDKYETYQFDYITWSGTVKLKPALGTFVTETIQSISVVEGTLLAPETSYNLRHSPKRMLLRWAKWLNGGLLHFPDNAVIKNTFVKQNGELTTVANNACLGRVGEQLKEKDGIYLADFNERERVFMPEWIRFTTRLTMEQVQLLRRCMTGATGTEKDYGYISVLSPKGDRVGGYIYNMEYNPNSEKVAFTLLKKNVVLHNTQDTDQVNCQDYTEWTFEDFENSTLGREIEDCRFINFN